MKLGVVGQMIGNPIVTPVVAVAAGAERGVLLLKVRPFFERGRLRDDRLLLVGGLGHNRKTTRPAGFVGHSAAPADLTKPRVGIQGPYAR